MSSMPGPGNGWFATAFLSREPHLSSVAKVSPVGLLEELSSSERGIVEGSTGSRRRNGVVVSRSEHMAHDGLTRGTEFQVLEYVYYAFDFRELP